MNIKLKIFLTILIGGASGFALAGHEAPVVDVQQDTASTQIESNGATWQSMPDAKQYHAQDSIQNDAQLSVQNESSNNNVAQDNTENNLAPLPTGSIDQRVSRLEQQIANLVRMNLPQQVNDLRQTMAQLQGELQVQDRDLKNLTKQQTNFYQDLQQN